MCHLEQTSLLLLQAVNGILLLPTGWEIPFLWPLIKIWHHMNMPGLAPSPGCVMTWEGQLMLGRGMAWTPGRGKMWHSYAPEDLRIQLCTLVTAESLGNMDLLPPKCFSSTSLFLELSVGGFGMAVKWLPCSNLRIACPTFPIHSNLRIVFSPFPVWDCFLLPPSQMHHGWGLIFHTGLNFHNSTMEMFIQFGKIVSVEVQKITQS